MRLEQAMPEIAAGKLSLAEIAFRAGFSSQASFTRAFYRMTGLTPGEVCALNRAKRLATFRAYFRRVRYSFGRGRAQDCSKLEQVRARQAARGGASFCVCGT